MTQIVYPTPNRAVSITHDSVGRVSSIADQFRTYINNFSYNGTGQLTGSSLGNGTTETYGYDTNRMQLISQTATAAGGQTNGLMNLHYYYQAQAGEMGAGTTAGNSGQLMAINSNSTINGTTENAAYTYDDLGRLVTSNQTSNGSSAQRRFTYDRWGNRIGMWDAASGGNQIQSIALQQSGGAPTNQIASVTSSGVAKNYVYDANGNLTNDGVHTYEYDAENRLNTVDAGATAAYAYDYQNRRIKRAVGATTVHSVWEGNQVIAEHDATTGAAIYNYVYLAGRLLARMGSGVLNWYLSDRLSGRLVLDSSGNVIGRMAHLPFGEEFGESGAQEKHHFTTYERDSETGTDYALNRQYSVNLGRFGSPDPQSKSRASASLGGYGDPQSLNLYSYARNDPQRFTDSSGLDLCFGYYAFWGTPNTRTGKIDWSYLGFIVDFCVAGTSGGQFRPGGSSVTGNNPPPQPNYNEKKKRCDEKLASMFGAPSAIAAGNGFDVKPDGSRVYRGDGDSNQLNHYMHLYGSADLTVAGNVYVPAGYDSHQWLGGDFGTAAFHYTSLAGMPDVTLVVRHLKSLDLGAVENGRQSVGQMGGLDQGAPVGPNYQHAHLELFHGNFVSTGGPSLGERPSLWISFSEAFCKN